MADSVINILTLARAGAATAAWTSFVEAGLDSVFDKPAVLTLKGRLLKDQARRAVGDESARLYLQSSEAYADAAALRPDSYPLINAATMSLFAGQPQQTTSLARQVLDLLERGTGVGETAYWHEATKAEAFLLLGQVADAEASLADGVAHAPEAWEDHATTLRQFRAILNHKDEPQDWLDAYAPPKSIYFNGIMGIAPDDEVAARAITAQLDRSSARFAYGALAAGADILVAEAMLAQGGELHVVLPVRPSAFKAQSVAPYGDEWLPRFDTLLEQAASVEIIEQGDRLSLAAIALAAKVAQGRAIDNAARLESKAVHCEVAELSAATPDAEPAGIIAVRRSAPTADLQTLESRHIVLSIATDASMLPDDIAWKNIGHIAVGTAGDTEQTARLLTRISKANAEATVAIHAFVADDAATGDGEAALLERLARTATAGTTIATGAAAMLLKALHPEIWIEPLGELPDASGALNIYALGRFDGTISAG